MNECKSSVPYYGNPDLQSGDSCSGLYYTFASEHPSHAKFYTKTDYIKLGLVKTDILGVLLHQSNHAADFTSHLDCKKGIEYYMFLYFASFTVNLDNYSVTDIGCDQSI